MSRRLSTVVRRDEGSTLVAVLVIMMVMTIIGLTLVTVVTNTTGIVIDNRDSAESRSAADSGLADVSVMLQQGTIVCDPKATPPAPVASDPASDVTYGVTISCTEAADGKRTVTLTSTGISEGGHTTITQATYGPGLAGALTTMTGGQQLTSSKSQANGNVLVNEGNFICSNKAGITETVVVRAGYAHLSNGCIVNTSLIAAGKVTLDTGAEVNGDVYAIGGAFAISHASTKVTGNVYVDGDVTLSDGHISGSLIATGNVTIESKATVDGGVHAGGRITVSGKTSITPLRSAFAEGSTPPIVTAPWQLAATAFEWVDVNYTPPAAGQSAPITACPPGNPVATIKSWANFTTPQIIDWRLCTADINLFQTPITLKTDLTIYVNRTVYMNGVVVSSGDGAPHQFNLIMPDKVADGKPTGPCPTGVRLDVNNLQMSDQISGAVYSPCNIDLGGAKWNGVVYGHQVSSFDGSTLTFKDVTLPNGNKLRPPLGTIITMQDIG